MAAYSKILIGSILGSKENTCETSGFPEVNVPVLSNTIVPALFRFSIWSPPLTMTPLLESLPLAARRAIGVPTASPHAPATTITDKVETTL